MFDLRNWKYSSHKSMVHALIGAVGFVAIMAPIVYAETQADGQQVPAGEEEVIDLEEEETEVKLLTNDPVFRMSAGEPAAAERVLVYNEEEESVLQALQILKEHDFIVRTEEVYCETVESYTKYVDNPVWTSDREELLQEGQEGELEVTVLITYRGDLEEEREVLQETVLEEAVPTIIERGTKEPSEYIRPIDEGRFTSGFGSRWGRMHRGLDWGVQEGTRVNAARDGVVVTASEMGAYGNAVYIEHEDGSQTRYAHLSVILVEVGQEVRQGDEIALSGNTGRSTGPHLHFEIRINGEAIDPLSKLD